MKFDFDENFVQLICSVIREAPVAHKVVHPMLQAIEAQANDPRIQSLDYPPDKPVEPVLSLVPIEPPSAG